MRGKSHAVYTLIHEISTKSSLTSISITPLGVKVRQYSTVQYLVADKNYLHFQSSSKIILPYSCASASTDELYLPVPSTRNNSVSIVYKGYCNGLPMAWYWNQHTLPSPAASRPGQDQALRK